MNAKRDALLAAVRVVLVFVLAGVAADARGDGGTVRASQRRGAFLVTVFTSPTPPHCGTVDVSVLVQDAATRQVRTDVAVVIRLHRASSAPLSVEATTAAATNKLLRAAQFELPQAGAWQVEVMLQGQEGDPIVCDLPVEEGPPVWLDLAWWVGWPVLAVVLFAAHRVLLQRQQRFQAGETISQTSVTVGPPSPARPECR